eukprot:2251643-Rhodomonas_salina.4
MALTIPCTARVQSHELRTPIHGILGLCNVLLASSDAKAPSHRILTSVQDSAERFAGQGWRRRGAGPQFRVEPERFGPGVWILRSGVRVRGPGSGVRGPISL